MCTRTSISIHDGYRLGASICIAWNLSVWHNERKAIFWALRKAKLSVCVPLEPLLVCIGAKRWLGISGRDRDGYRALDRVNENLALV